LDDTYLNLFEEIENIFEKLDLLTFMNTQNNTQDLEKKLVKIISLYSKRVDLFYDALKPLNSEHNSNIISFLKGLKYCLVQKLFESD
jgi:hypothetical protein